jgi:hypothetical protein
MAKYKYKFRFYFGIRYFGDIKLHFYVHTNSVKRCAKILGIDEYEVEYGLCDFDVTDSLSKLIENPHVAYGHIVFDKTQSRGNLEINKRLIPLDECYKIINEHLKCLEKQKKQISAIEWLFEQLKVNNYISDNAHWLIDEAKEMEKKQIVYAWENGYEEGTGVNDYSVSTPNIHGIVYYNNTFLKKNINESN